MNLAGRSAVITGASQGLGRAIAEHYVRAGASVLLVARGEELLRRVAGDVSQLISHAGQRVLARPGDVGRPESCAEVAALAVRELPDLCALVNNAGVYGPLGPLEA